MTIPRQRIVLPFAALVFIAAVAAADSTIRATDRYGWAANAGWLDWRANVTHGVVFNVRFASGYIHAPNFGWIHLGDGTPANGSRYANNSGTDYGINVDLSSNPNEYLLNGYAWSANAAWIQFSGAFNNNPQVASRMEKATGILRGWAWSANLGWIALESPGVALVRTNFQNAAENWVLYE